MGQVSMKPKIGRRIYCIHGSAILADTVGYIGEDSFIIASYGPSTYTTAWEWNYDDYNKRWFTNLTKAKQQLIKNFSDMYEGKLKVEKVDDNYYALKCC